MRFSLSFLLALLLLFLPAQAQTITLSQEQLAELERLLSKLEDYPALVAAKAQAEAAQAQLRSAFDPVVLSADAGYALFDNEDLGANPQQVNGPTTEIPESSTQLSLELSFRPVPFGDIADLAETAEIDLRDALLSFREMVATLQVQALESALNAALAQEAFKLAQEGAKLAQEAFDINSARFAKGAASAAELRLAEQNLRQAENRLLNSEADFELAKLALLDLVGEVILPEIPAIPPAQGTAPAISRAELNLRRAQVGLRRAERELYPVAQAGFNWNIDDNNSLSLSLESRTLQPSVAYNYQDPGRQLPENLVNTSFQIGVGLSISPGVFNRIDAAKAQVKAASAGLEANRDRDAIEQRILANNIQKTERSLALSQLALENAQQDLDEISVRESLGLATALERQQTFVAFQQARLELQNAQLEALKTVLATYNYYAIPLSEVVK